MIQYNRPHQFSALRVQEQCKPSWPLKDSLNKAKSKKSFHQRSTEDLLWTTHTAVLQTSLKKSRTGTEIDSAKHTSTWFILAVPPSGILNSPSPFWHFPSSKHSKSLLIKFSYQDKSIFCLLFDWKARAVSRYVFFLSLSLFVCVFFTFFFSFF